MTGASAHSRIYETITRNTTMLRKVLQDGEVYYVNYENSGRVAKDVMWWSRDYEAFLLGEDRVDYRDVTEVRGPIRWEELKPVVAF